MSSRPIVTSNTPYAIQVESGKDYYWCSCGRTSAEPLCDGAGHKGTSFTPQKFTAEEDKTVYFCGCRQSANPMLCDGAHKSI
jgi:CDGSH iron-sulfur domain-containing protein 3